MKIMILAALTVLGLTACTGPTVNGPTVNGPTVNGPSDTAQLVPGEPHVATWFPANGTVFTPPGPYDNTANSLGGRSAGTYGGN